MQCTINLQSGALEFGSCDAVLPFLGESEIPVDFKRQAEEMSNSDAGAGGSGSGGRCTWTFFVCGLG